MFRKNPSPAPKQNILPYRDVNNSTIAYAAPGSAREAGPNSVTEVHYDSDYEPLIENPSRPELQNQLSDHDLEHFTATGRPAPKFKASALMNLGAGEAYSMPQLLPKRYTDDSIIPAIVTNIIPSPKPPTEILVEGGRRKSFLSKFKSSGKLELNKEGIIKMKVIYMPRRDYLKSFARDEKGEYIGKEPYKQWSEDELEAAFAQYAPKPDDRKGYRIPT